MTNNLTMVYPSNIGVCWIACQCNLCKNTRKMLCSSKDHKNHLEKFSKDCLVQQSSQCEDHWVTHPDNFQVEEDIFVEKNVFFHHGELVEQPRNHIFDKIKLAGIKKKCTSCRENVYDHFQNHLVVHLNCKLCVFQEATMNDAGFWEKSLQHMW